MQDRMDKDANLHREINLECSYSYDSIVIIVKNDIIDDNIRVHRLFIDFGKIHSENLSRSIIVFVKVST
jgi:hypothetical protein